MVSHLKKKKRNFLRYSSMCYIVLECNEYLDLSRICISQHLRQTIKMICGKYRKQRFFKISKERVNLTFLCIFIYRKCLISSIYHFD